MLIAWVDLYGEYVITEKLAKFRTEYEKFTGDEIPWLKILGYYAVSKGLNKWKLLAIPANKQFTPAPFELTSIYLERDGIKPWLKNSNLNVPNSALNADKKINILKPFLLAQKNSQFRYRLLLGASWRADVAWLIKERQIEKPSKIKETLGCSYEPAYRISKEIKLFLAASTKTAKILSK